MKKENSHYREGEAKAIDQKKEGKLELTRGDGFDDKAEEWMNTRVWWNDNKANTYKSLRMTYFLEQKYGNRCFEEYLCLE